MLDIFLTIGTYELQYSEILLAILGILSLVILLQKSCNKKVFIYGNLFIFSVVMSVITLLLFPLEHRVVAYGMSWRSYFLWDYKISGIYNSNHKNEYKSYIICCYIIGYNIHY